MKRVMLSVLLLVSGLAHAHGMKVAVPDNPKWKEECGSCHLAYPPRFLSAESWRKLMAGLDKHFGDNASLDPQVNREILDFLVRNAGSGDRYSAASLRISDTPWFTRKHREIPARAWTDPAVKSRANCAACHVNAARGDWSEHGVRMPAGFRQEEEEDEESE